MTEADIASEINKRGFELYEQISVSEIERVPKTNKENDSNSKLIGEAECLGTYNIPKGHYLKHKHSDLLDNLVEIYCDINDKKIGYDEIKFLHLSSLAIRFLDVEYFSRYADYNFLVTAIFDWIVDLFDNSFARYNLYTYIKNQVETELKSYTYFFKVKDLVIEDEFTVGNSTFTFRKIEYFESVFTEILSCSNYLKPENKKDFLSSNESFLNTVLISTTVKSVKEKAKLLAKKEVELSINAIKCLLIKEVFKFKNELFNVDYLNNNTDSSKYFSVSESVKNFTLHMERKGLVQPIIISKNVILELENGGLKKINKFLIYKKCTELYYRLELQINLLGEINSTTDLYIRIIKLISFFENIIIPVNKLRGKGQTHMKKIINYLGENDKEKFTTSVNKIYDIRDKYLHNRNKLPIESNDLVCVSVLAIMFLLTTIDLSNNLISIEELQIEFGIINKLKI